VRRLTGALIPFVALVVVIATGTSMLEAIAAGLDSLIYPVQLLIGAALGALLLEVCHHAGHDDASAGLFAMFLGALASFMLWAVIGGALSLISTALLGFIVGTGFHVVFRGLPP
jgi:hypothetical protein